MKGIGYPMYDYIIRFLDNQTRLKKITHTEKSLFISILPNDQEKYTFTYERFAEDTATGLRQVKAAFKKFIAWKWLKKVNHRGKAYSYDLGDQFAGDLAKWRRANEEGVDFEYAFGGKAFRQKCKCFKKPNRRVTEEIPEDMIVDYWE